MKLEKYLILHALSISFVFVMNKYSLIYLIMHSLENCAKPINDISSVCPKKLSISYIHIVIGTV